MSNRDFLSAVVTAHGSCFSFIGDYIQASADDVIISQLQDISEIFSSYPSSEEFC